ncbi:MAG: trypsin-like peptidase domain-containing protein [Armatimonadota bacterium]|nr:trypsin-like peptidase domain-containing protein [Armatimonadota bacterium]
MSRIRSVLPSRGVLIAALLAVVVILQIITLVGGFNSNRAVAAPVVSDQAMSAVRGLQAAFTSIADSIEPTIVYIKSEKKVAANDPFEEFRRWGFPVPPRGDGQVQTASGSGVIVRSDGYVLTNDHVVGGMDKVTVITSDKREFKGTVLRDPTTDLALIKINATNLPAAPLGDSDKVRPGQWALAFGNPGGQQFTNSLTVGVVSAITREFVVPDPDSPNNQRMYPDAIQTDAAINPGNSGGPLVNIDGQVIGVNAAIWSPTGASVGIGFAIPSNTAKYVMDQLISKGKVMHGRLGVRLKDLDDKLGRLYGVSKGALVESVEEGSPAEKAKVQEDDVITQFNGRPIDSAAALISAVRKTPAGTKAGMMVIREKKPVTLQITVGEAADVTASNSEVGGGKIGLTVTELTPSLARQLKVHPATKGVVVDSVEEGSPAVQAGIQEGDVIRRVNDKLTPTVEAYDKAVEGLKSGDTAIIALRRGKIGRIVEVELD